MKSGALHAFWGCDFLRLRHLGGFKTESFLGIWNLAFWFWFLKHLRFSSCGDNPVGLWDRPHLGFLLSRTSLRVGVGGFRDIGGWESGAHTFGIGSCWWVPRHSLLAISLSESEIWTAFEVFSFRPNPVGLRNRACWLKSGGLAAFEIFKCRDT